MNAGGMGAVDTSNIVLVPTRPLLKALAKECKPSPPWSVGQPVPQSLTEELRQFALFLRDTPTEQHKWSSLMNTAEAVAIAVWPQSRLHEMGATAAGILTKDSAMHLYATDSEDTPERRQRLKEVANEHGFQVEFGVDYRQCITATLTEMRTGERCVVRFGADAIIAAPAAELLTRAILGVPERHAALFAIDSLLRQNKVLDDTGNNDTLLNSEAAAMMLLAIANSYSRDDQPDAGRLLLDFFLTYGFPAHFDCTASSVNYLSMEKLTPKQHPDCQLSVLDVHESQRNLTPRLDRFAHLQGVFNYCYTAISQFTQVASSQRRAQSALSTIIGGETFWSRVLQLYHQEIQPYRQIVQEKHHILAQLL